jgi:DNA-binding response OmpR family regulator
VEDHADTALLMERILKRFGHRVRVATTVAAALSIAATYPFDLLISDIGLPDGTGLDLIRELRIGRSVVGIAVSGFGMESDIAGSLEAGFVAHLTKPIDVGRLERIMGEICV